MRFYHSSAVRPAAIVGGLLVLAVAWAGPLAALAGTRLTGHMLQHLVVMNAGALLLAAGLPRQRAGLGTPSLVGLTLLQLAALWLWHAPAVFDAVHHSTVLQGLMQVSLFVAALLFWRCVMARPLRLVWQTIFALLITAKTFCLLGALLAFSRRPLYALHATLEPGAPSVIADQQLAGLLMISSCVLVYVAAAVTLFARWLLLIATQGEVVSSRTGSRAVALAD